MMIEKKSLRIHQTKEDALRDIHGATKMVVQAQERFKVGTLAWNVLNSVFEELNALSEDFEETK